ncbi:hypothetical protein HHI36_012606 [Cryptolaemus montrouzieri]|uniref:Uncharacterized protein n=1 Tax=Cryptolaemus montrouzieri TaxID=559131 RepID=A0ABD2NFD7_9CUCU
MNMKFFFIFASIIGLFAFSFAYPEPEPEPMPKRIKIGGKRGKKLGKKIDRALHVVDTAVGVIDAIENFDK